MMATARKPFLFDGRQVGRGDTVDLSMLTLDRQSQLINQRYVTVETVTREIIEPTEEELVCQEPECKGRQFKTANGFSAHQRMHQGKLKPPNIDRDDVADFDENNSKSK